MIIILSIIAIICNCTSDEIRFHYGRWFARVVPKKLNQWINPSVSWENKYRIAPNSKVITWVFSTGLVFVTDLWHFLKFVTLNCIFSVVIILIEPTTSFIMMLLMFNLCWGILYGFFSSIYGLLSDRK